LLLSSAKTGSPGIATPRHASFAVASALPPAPVKPSFPKLATVRGITLESTLAALRAAYRLHLAGAGRWHSDNGLIFVSNAQHSPAPLSSRIIEIKTSGACGDF
jgi:hypothetical protein